MTRNQSCQLVDMLAEVPDPRKKKGLWHPLAAMFGVLVVGQQRHSRGKCRLRPPRQSESEAVI